ncbi:hypothetical protein DRJ17_01870 [Candidatus Woesearchaeota archaeon]|nr:MAG: hypothetical protein DRJ17_01870 [Candidatus Woesearchaeota archaeon]
MNKKKEKKSKKKGYKKEKSKERIKFCPRCGSTMVFTDITSAASVALGDINRLRCKNCNYSGQFFPEMESEKIKNVKVCKEKPAGKTEAINVSYGYGIRAYYLPMGAVFLLSSIFVLKLFNVTMAVFLLVAGAFFMAYCLLVRRRE